MSQILYTSPVFTLDCDGELSDLVLVVEPYKDGYMVLQHDLEDGKVWNVTPTFFFPTLAEAVAGAVL